MINNSFKQNYKNLNNNFNKMLQYKLKLVAKC